MVSDPSAHGSVRLAPQLTNADLNDCIEDLLPKDAVHGTRCFAYLWTRCTAALLVIGSAPIIWGCVNSHWKGVLIGTIVVTGLAVVTSIFVGLYAIIGRLAWRTRLPRTISIRDGKFVVSENGRNREFDLAECTWREGSTSGDNIELFTGLREAIIVQTPGGSFSIGYVPGTRECWREFLTLHRIPVRRPVGCLTMLAAAIVGALAGMLVGLLAGLGVQGVTNRFEWLGALTLLGVFDGFGIGLLYVTATADHPEEGRKRLQPFIVATIFGAIGLKCGVAAGVVGVAACAIGNVFVGLVAALYCQRKIQRETEKLASEREVAA
jgi:hypothetical protein